MPCSNKVSDSAIKLEQASRRDTGTTTVKSNRRNRRGAHGHQREKQEYSTYNAILRSTNYCTLLLGPWHICIEQLYLLILGIFRLV